MRYFLLSFFSICILLTACNKTTSLVDVIEEYESFKDTQKDDVFPWPKVKATDIKEELVFQKSILQKLEKIPRTGMSDTDMINYEMLHHIVSHKVYNLEYESHLIPINSEGGFVTGIIFRTQNSQIQNPEQLEKYLNRLRSLPEYIDDQILNMTSGLELGKKSSKFITSKFLNILNPQVESFNEDNLFQKPLEGYKEEIGEDTRKELQTLIDNSIPDAYRRLSQFMSEEYLPQAYDDIGASYLPAGKKYYEQRVNYFTTLEITPEEIFNQGLSEVARIKADMEGIIKELEFKGSWEDFFDFLRTDPQFYAKTPEEILMRASWICKEMEYEMPKYFGHMPRMPFSVKPVPMAIARNYTAGRYSGGSYENNKAGEYWVNTTKLESRPLYALPALSLHEAVPGHHTQNMLAAEMTDLPKFRRTYLSAFGEGWGLYSEYLGIEAGIYKTPYEHFGRMTYEMWRACRLVVDVGMHYKGWSRQKAFDFMASNTALSIHEVNTEIDRYIGWPAQAVSYKMGEIKIRELRKMAEEKLGAEFDIREFHDKVLENGSIPLSTLERIINQYVNSVL